MCGILLLVQDSREPLPPFWPSLQIACSNRGPHHRDSRTCQYQQHSAHLYASVLSLRGDSITVQPLCSQDARFLLAWNGQVYDIRDSDIASFAAARTALTQGANDAQEVLRLISQATHYHESSKRDNAVELALQDVTTRLEGEWAMVLLDVSALAIASEETSTD